MGTAHIFGCPLHHVFAFQESLDSSHLKSHFILPSPSLLFRFSSLLFFSSFLFFFFLSLLFSIFSFDVSLPSSRESSRLLSLSLSLRLTTSEFSSLLPCSV